MTLSARRRLALLISSGLLAAMTAISMLPPGTSGSVGPIVPLKVGKKCPKGKKLVVVKKNGKVVRKNGKPVKKCVKRKAKPKLVTPPPPQPPAPTGLFEAPGRVLEGEEAKPFLQKYLVNSTFTDCVPGWPACGGFENRYSHSANATFYKCLLRPTSGSDVKSVGEYGFSKAKVEPDGSWYYQEVVAWYGYQTLFEWHVLQNGTVTGANANQGEAPEQIGPLTYVGGIAKDCSY
jgi:hypothetical protein